VILDNGLRTAIVAVNKAFGILELVGHRLALDGAIQVSECRFHVGDGLATKGTSVRTFGVLRETLVVNTVATSHDDDSFWRSEHVVATYGTVTLGGAFNATMSVFNAHRKANRACL
jgi:hypothetical protein